MTLRRTATILLGPVVAALAACGEGSPTANPTPTPSPTGSAWTAPYNDADVAFLTAMIPHHQQAVMMADHAAARGASVEVKQLAAAVRTAQGPEVAEMSQWLRDWGRPVPTPLSRSAAGTGHGGAPGGHGMASGVDMDKLAAASGAAFDRMFLTMMIAHHEGSLTIAKEEQAEGGNQQARQLAEQIVTTQSAEIATMRDLLEG